VAPETCPVCGFNLGFKPWQGESASDEFCLSCGIQFGYTDSAGGDLEARKQLYVDWRCKWIAEGMPWRGVIAPPKGWDPRRQLENLRAD
jgi:hypothetical protein